MLALSKSAGGSFKYFFLIYISINCLVLCIIRKSSFLFNLNLGYKEEYFRLNNTHFRSNFILLLVI